MECGRQVFNYRSCLDPTIDPYWIPAYHTEFMQVQVAVCESSNPGAGRGRADAYCVRACAHGARHLTAHCHAARRREGEERERPHLCIADVIPCAPSAGRRTRPRRLPRPVSAARGPERPPPFVQFRLCFAQRTAIAAPAVRFTRPSALSACALGIRRRLCIELFLLLYTLYIFTRIRHGHLGGSS
jgi:hypothetical protein